MKKPPLTPEEKAHKKLRDALHLLHNRIASAFSFGKIKTWRDVYLHEGLSEEEIEKRSNANNPVTYAELKPYFEEKGKALDAKLATPKPPAAEPAKPVASPTQPTIATPTPTPVVSAPETAATDESGLNNTNDYGLVLSPNEKAFLFWFQKKATKELYDGIVKYKKRNQLLLASTGTGKTFMVSGLVRRLVDIKFADGKTFGSTKYLYITRATVVEQTKRVFANEFNLTVKDGVEVLNIEQLRARAGQVWINEEMIVQDGEEKTIYKWRPMLHPVVFILDECQSAKNDGTAQSEIIRAYAKLPVKDTYMVFVSATPFCKVAEAKSFVLNLHLNDTEFDVD